MRRVLFISLAIEHASTAPTAQYTASTSNEVEESRSAKMRWPMDVVILYLVTCKLYTVPHAHRSTSILISAYAYLHAYTLYGGYHVGGQPLLRMGAEMRVS